MNENKLISLLNELFKIQKITVQQLNIVVPFVENVPILRELEKNNKELGLAQFDTEKEGISVFSLIATITDVLVGKRLAFVVDQDGTIAGVSWFPE